MQRSVTMLVIVGVIFFIIIFVLSELTNNKNLKSVKKKVTGDGQHGTARWATQQEIETNYEKIIYDPVSWRKGENLPQKGGVIVHTDIKLNTRYAYVETDDVHTLMTAASGSGKTTYFLYPNIEYACACGVSFITTDTKGDLYRNYAGIAEKYYGYTSVVIDLRNPTKSDGDNMMYLVNKYMDMYLKDENDLASKAKAEKHAKILADTIINSGSEGSGYGQNAYFYESAQGLLAAVIIIVAEFAKPEERHIISVFKMIQELMKPSTQKGKTQCQILLDLLPEEHIARMLAGASLFTAEQAMMSVTSTALSKLNAFLDSELQQVLCFDTALDMEKFCSEKQAIYLIMPEEDSTKYFLISLMIQQIYQEILVLADAKGGKLGQRVIFFMDEIGTIPPIQSMQMMLSAARSRGVALVPIIQDRGQFEDKYGEAKARTIFSNCANGMTGGFSPYGDAAQKMSDDLGTQTVTSATVTKTKEGVSVTEQMVESRLMYKDELICMQKGKFIVWKVGMHPFIGKLDLFFNWGITFEDKYTLKEKGARKVKYASKDDIEQAIIRKYIANVHSEDTLEIKQKTANGVRNKFDEPVIMEIEIGEGWNAKKKIEKIVERV